MSDILGSVYDIYLGCNSLALGLADRAVVISKEEKYLFIVDYFIPFPSLLNPITPFLIGYNSSKYDDRHDRHM